MLECDLFPVLMHLLRVWLRLVVTLECELFLVLMHLLRVLTQLVLQVALYWTRVLKPEERRVKELSYENLSL